MDGAEIANRNAYKMSSKETTTMFRANVGYTQVFPPSGLTLYRDGERQNTTKVAENATEMNGTYSLQLDIDE